jgi:hypothetical protein
LLFFAEELPSILRVPAILGWVEDELGVIFDIDAIGSLEDGQLKVIKNSIQATVYTIRLLRDNQGFTRVQLAVICDLFERFQQIHAFGSNVDSDSDIYDHNKMLKKKAAYVG